MADKILTGEKLEKAYRAPKLTIYGSVREMTGNNSGLQSGDSGTMMV